MILTDKVPDDRLVLPPDNLTLQERLDRLFSGIERRWRLLAVLTLNSVASDLIKPEIVSLARSHGPQALAIRVCFVQEGFMDTLDKELAHWNDEHIVATGDSIHACRFLMNDPTPRIFLFDPDGRTAVDMIGFDNVSGLDSVEGALLGKTMKNH